MTRLTPHFTLEELTHTSHDQFKAENADVTDNERRKLTEVAVLLEAVRDACGPWDVHCARRCPGLNAAVGGASNSQHLLCEAADGSPAGLDTEESVNAAFEKLVEAAKAGKLPSFGQLIMESAKGKFWIHISLGQPYRNAARCGEILRMKEGKYALVLKIAGGKP